MSKRAIRRITDFIVLSVFIAMVLHYAPWWMAIASAVFGMWNYYDGATRMSLPD